MFFGIWWFIGFWLVLAARFFIVNDPKHGETVPLTWGGVIGCFLVGFVGPLAAIAAVPWGVLYIIEWTQVSGNCEFLKQPVFKQKK